MIDPSELRKGNIVEYNGEQVKVVGFDEEYVYLNIPTVDYVGFDEVFPIEITKQILLDSDFIFKKCGISGADIWQGLDFWDKECDMSYLTLRGSIKHGLKIQGHINSRIKFLHELQNLYYWITRKELQLTK